MSNELKLSVGGKTYTGWTSVRVEKSLDALCGAFEVYLADTSPLDRTDWALRMGEEYKLYLGDELFLVGYIEDINLGYADTEHTIQIAGRDKLGDLVDCHRAEKTREWSNYSMFNIIKTLCAPYGVAVQVHASAVAAAAKREVKFGVNPGDTVFDSIRRLCRKHFLLPISQGDGVLMLAKEGSDRATDRLETGVNVLRGNLRQSDRDRFSVYHSKGMGVGIDFGTLEEFTQPGATARDSLIKRYRPLIILEDTSTYSGDCKERAAAESALRAGESREYEYEVLGWRQSDGSLWEPNLLVAIKDTVFGVDDTMVVNRVSFTLDDSGERTILQLCSPEKYKAQAKVEQIKSTFDAKEDDLAGIFG